MTLKPTPSKTKTLAPKVTSSCFVALLGLMFGAGCSQGVDAVSIRRNTQETKTYTYLSDTNLQGIAPSAPQSGSFVLRAHHAGGNSVDTTSSSSSFRLTGGVVIR